MAEQAHPKRDCGPQRAQAGAEETSEKEAAVEEQGEKHREAERNRYVLTPECNLGEITRGEEMCLECS